MTIDIDLIDDRKNISCDWKKRSTTNETTKFLNPKLTFNNNARDKNPLCVVRIVGGYYFLIRADVLMFVHLFLFFRKDKMTQFDLLQIFFLLRVHCCQTS